MPRNSYSLSRYPGYPPDWDEIRKAVYKRDGYQCANYPNCPDTPDAKILQAHHIIPLSKGGTNNMSNLKTVCRACHEKLHPHMQDRYPGVWDDDEDDDDDYDIDITPSRSGYSTSRHYNATYSASAAAKRKSSSSVKWGWIAAAACIILAWLFLRNPPERNVQPTSVVVATVGVLPQLYSGPSTKCESIGQLASSSDAVVTGWVSSRGETWFRVNAGGWLPSANVSPRDRDEALRTRMYQNVPDCWENIRTPTPTAPPTVALATPTIDRQPSGPRDLFPGTSLK